MGVLVDGNRRLWVWRVFREDFEVNFASMLFGTTQLPNYPVTRHVRLANLPMKFRVEQAAKNNRAEQLEKARQARSAKREAANRATAKDYVATGEFSQSAYAYMLNAYPRWITAEELETATGINKNTVSTILYNMALRGHLEKMKQSGKGRLRFKLYRLVMK